jgi:general stress protein 26
MTEPVTTLDERFSQPGTAATPWEQTRRSLEAAQLFWITTVRADGRPHSTPTVAVWLDGALYFCTGAGEQKGVNLRHSPHVVLATGSTRWDLGLDIAVEGDAVRVTDAELLTRLARAWEGKWDGRWHFEPRDGAFWHQDGGEALVYRVTPAKVLAFGQGTFTHTSHRFT